MSSASQPQTSLELAKTYKPSDHEATVWSLWMKAQAFEAKPERVLSGGRKPFCILIPPPNVTAALHLGHALNNTLQDALVRMHRMMGDEVLWMAGTDHAGIATQAVVEKRVQKEEKKRKSDFTREAFVAKIQAFKDEYEAVITGQLKAMGCSCDWSRQRFTMDEQCAAAVREAFFRLFRDGLIYRGKRLVNWDPALQTAVADDECYEEEIDGAFYLLRYPVILGSKPVTWGDLSARGYPGASEHDANAQAWITVATTRPETYLGDTAVALNPYDPRAASLRGLFVQLPLLGREIPIIEDSYVVLPERFARSEEEKNDPKAKMATGFLKVTPAHDPNDYEIGQRHNLPRVNMMSPDGKVSDKHGLSDVREASVFVGLKMAEARKKVVEEFKARGLFEESKPHKHSVKHSDRSKAIVEPYLSDQWYVRVTDEKMAQGANEALVAEQRSGVVSGAAGAGSEKGNAGSMSFFPERYAKSYEQWHDNIRDWCISRQLWWGHQIPVWSKTYPGWAENRGNPGDEQDELSDIIEGLEHNDFLSYRLSSPKHPGVDLRMATVTKFDLDSVRDLHVQVCIGRPGEQSTYVGQLDIEKRLEAAGFTRDPDVLDTWFSSALWPLSTMGWPDATKAWGDNPRSVELNKDLLQAFNPTSVLCTAREIITLWVSRMVMFNRYFLAQESQLGPAPFKHVYIHAVVQDGEGRKMSKSLGNGVDPLDIIATHGCDAMRYTLCQMATQTQDVRMPVQKDNNGKNTSPKFDLGRNFANKLWNASRFALGMIAPTGGATGAAQLASTSSVHPSISPSLLDRWMLSRLHAGIEAATTSLSTYQFAEHAQGMYQLVWNEFCDWYLEGVKPTVASSPQQQAVLHASLDSLLRLLHPTMPYITESLWQVVYPLRQQAKLAEVQGLSLGAVQGDATDEEQRQHLLCRAPWPKASASLRDEGIEATFDALRGLVSVIRDLRATHKVAPSRKITLHIPAQGIALLQGEHAKELAVLLSTYANLAQIARVPAQGSAVAFAHAGEQLAMSDLHDASAAGEANADAAKQAEKARLEKLVTDLTRSIGTLEGRLNNPGYADKAPPAMVQQSREQLAKSQGELASAQAALRGL